MDAANPFDYEHPASAALFVNRNREMRSLQTYCTSNANVILIAPRRYGKTSLLLETFRRLPKSTHIPLYVDVLDTLNDREVAERILHALGTAAYGRVRRGWERLARHCKRIRPDLVIRPDDGTVTLSIRLAEPSLPSLQDALEALETTGREAGKRVVLVIDEFQTILERPAMGETVRAMRTVMQHQRHVTYILSGSKRHTLLGLTRDERQPFYGQLDLLEIGGIPLAEFVPVARKLFLRTGRQLPPPALARIGDLCRDHPKRIQQCLFSLHADATTVTPAAVDAAVSGWVARETHRFDDDLARVKEGPQKRLLIGLAVEGGVKTIYGKEFLRKYDVGTTAHAARAAGALEALGLLDAAHRFVDPFFFQHLRHRRSLALASVP